MKKIGFIGLDIMGKPIAKNLMKVDYLIIIHDLHNIPIEKLVSECPEKAISPKDVAAKSEIVTTMLPNSIYVR